MIDKQTGEIKFPGWDISLSPAVTREVFLKSPLAQGAKVTVNNEPYCSWRLVPTNGEDQKWWHTIVYFKGEKLYQINLAASDDESGSGWEDWSEEFERHKKDYYTALVERFLGFSRQQDFSWGSVEAVYDEKTGGSYIMIKY
jgi:hypothetical protein